MSQRGFRITAIPALADRYWFRGEGAERAVSKAGLRAHKRGCYTRAEFLVICEWKSTRTKKLCSDPSNSDRLVRAVTRIALSTKVEEVKIAALLVLRGVSWPTASVLLHFATSNRYPIIDYRALWSMGYGEPPHTYTFELWRDYTTQCRCLAKEAGVTMRQLDRALWQYSKEKQPPAALKIHFKNHGDGRGRSLGPSER